MKLTRKSFCLLATLAVSGTFAGCSAAGPAAPGAPATPAAGQPLRLFLIGNSFSQNATRYLPQLAKAGGHEVVIGRAEIGGAPLQTHWEAAAAHEANPDDPKGKPYLGKSLSELLSAGTWDVVTIQQGSFVSSAIATYEPYAKNLRDYIQKLQPNAEVVMHQTWAYRADAAKFGAVRPNHLAENQNEMWEKSRKAYQATAKELGLRLIPNGDAFQAVNSDPKWGYKKDPNYDFANPVFPNLPDQTHSLNEGYRWGTDKAGAKVLNFDPNHANDAGCYLGGLVWYGFLFNESPEKLTFVPEGIPADFAAHLREVAWKTVQEAMAGQRGQ